MCRESKLSLGEAKFKARHKRRLSVKVKQEMTQKIPTNCRDHKVTKMTKRELWEKKE